MPTSSSVDSITITLSRVPTSGEMSDAILKCYTSNYDDTIVNYEFFEGLVQTTTLPEQGIGTYTLSGKVLTISFAQSKKVQSLTFSGSVPTGKD